MTSPFSDKYKFCKLDNGLNMAYVDAGNPTGDPIVFLHGNPTSSYMWRNIMSGLNSADHRRMIAPDLIGMGQSDKLTNPTAEGYTFSSHAKYLDEFLSKCIDLTSQERKVVLVIHDWGSALGFWWARRNAEKVQGIVYMEAMVMPISKPPPDFGAALEFVRSDQGENAVLNENFSIEKFLPGAIVRKLTQTEMDEYRKPFLKQGTDRLPTLVFPRSIPIGGEPAETFKVFSNYSAWLPTTNDIPKLFINTEPGVLIAGEAREFARSLPNQVEVTVAPGIHYIQEDHPEAIALAIDGFLTKFPSPQDTTTSAVLPN